MTVISYALIKANCPWVLDEKNSSTSEGEREVLSLNNLDIDAIDGLEIVPHIEELHLNNNNIEIIENIEFLFKLRILDVSNNSISSESLRNSIDLLPKSLTSINLLNNPCCKDESVLCELQDKFPSLGIIVGFEDNSEEEDDEDDEEDLENEEYIENNNGISNIHTNNNQDVDLLKYSPLDADEILKQIVDRKCRLSNINYSFNMDDALKTINSDSDQAMQNVVNRSKLIVKSNHIDEGEETSIEDNQKNHISLNLRASSLADQLMVLSKSNREPSLAFLDKFKR